MDRSKQVGCATGARDGKSCTRAQLGQPYYYVIQRSVISLCTRRQAGRKGRYHWSVGGRVEIWWDSLLAILAMAAGLRLGCKVRKFS